MNNTLLERNINNCPNYCKERETISTSDDRLHLLEVDGLCPLCGNSLLGNKGKKTKLYQIAHIYPNSPTENERVILDGVSVLGENSESFQNKIALCLNCHKNYDFQKKLGEYNNLLNIKKQLYNSDIVKAKLSSIDISENLEVLLRRIIEVDFSKMKPMELRLNPLELKKKFSSSETLLKIKVTNYVTEYFLYLKKYFKNLEENNQLNFSCLATIIRLAYQNSTELLKSKQEVFDSLVDWLLTKTATNDRSCAEVVISYFVQNCEVFDEITE